MVLENTLMLSQGPCDGRKCNAQAEFIERLAFDVWHHGKCKAKASEMFFKTVRIPFFFLFSLEIPSK